MFAGLQHCLAVDSILEGHTPAWVYGDETEAPRTGWLWDRQGEIFLAGEANRAATNRALAGLITGHVVPDAQSRGIPGLALFYDAPAWEAQIPALLGDVGPAGSVGPQKRKRRFYAFARPELDWHTTLPSGSVLQRLDETWLARRDVPHIDQVAGWVDSFWRSHADFVAHSFGFTLLDQGAAASWCLGVFVSGAQVELAVATVPAWRGRGYATAVAARAVAFCAEQGLTPHWHCWDDNIASWRIAEKIGFVHPSPYTVYYVDIGAPAF